MDVESTSLPRLLFVSFVANLGSFLFGYDFGAASWLISWFETYDDDDNYSYYSTIGNSNALIGLVGASGLFGAVISYVLLLLYGNSISKRDELLIAAIFYFVGALIESLSVYASWTDSTGFVWLIIGRWIYGAGIATALHSAPLYAASMGPKELRGTAGATTEVMISLGIFSSYLVGYFNSTNVGWSVIFRFGYIIAFVMGTLAYFLPHLPLHLTLTGRPDDEIISSLQFVFPKAGFVEVNMINTQIEEIRKEKLHWEALSHKYEKKQTWFWHYVYPLLSPELKVFVTDRANRYSLYLVVFLVFTLPLTGLVALMYYANTIFTYLDASDASTCVLGLGATKVISAVLLLFIADMMERREFILLGISLMVAGLIGLVVGYHFTETGLAVTGAFTAVFGYELSLGTFSWVLISELFPNFVGSAANSIAVSVLLLLMGAMNFLLPSLLDTTGVVNLFSFFIGVTVVQAITVYLYLPNTRGVSIELAYKLVIKQAEQTNRNYFPCCFESRSADYNQVADELDSDDTQVLV